MTQRSELQKTWAGLTSGQHLTHEEYEQLRNALNDGRIGPELVADLQLHRALAAQRAIDESSQLFVDRLSAALSSHPTTIVPEQQAVPPPAAAPPELVDVVPSQRANVRRPKKASLRIHPLVLTLAFSTASVVMLLAMMLHRYDTVKQQLAEVTEQLHSQQSEFDRQIARERAGNTNVSTQPAERTEEPVGRLEKPIAYEAPELARLTGADSAVWRDGPTSSALQAGAWELESGTAELTMPGGSQLLLTGPTSFDLKDGHHIAIERGSLTAFVAPDDIGFCISTPTSRIVDLGTEFQVAVSDDGKTEVSLIEGEVVVIPWDDGPAGKRWRLAKNSFEKTIVSPSTNEGRRMLATQTVGSDRFEGQIRLEDATVDLDSQEHFERLRDGLKTKLASSPADAVADWLQLAQTMNATTGLVELNGETIPIEGLQDVLKFENGLLNMSKLLPPGDFQQNRSFSGKVNINGQERTFTNPAEYEAFRKEMFQSLPSFGLPSPAQTQFEIDKQNNPFQTK